MNKFAVIVCLLLSGSIFSQNKDKANGYISFQYNNTIYDRTLSNNSSGIGIGVELLLNPTKKFHSTLQLNGNFFAGTKELYTVNGKPVDSKETMSTVFGGLQFDAGKRFFSSLTTGAAFYNGGTYFGLRPSLGFYTSGNKKLSLSTSFTTIFQRDEISNDPFGYISFALALKFL